MAEYLTTFANVLDEFFKGLSDCGLMTSYTVQLQSNITGVETMFKFRTVIQELMRHLQNLLSSIPSIQCAEASTQTLEDATEVLVTCHPISLAALTNNRLISTSNDDFSKDCNNMEKNNQSTEHKSDSSTMATVVPSIELCELKPLLIKTSEEFSEIVNLQQSIVDKEEKGKVENIVHIVVEAPSNNTRSYFEDNLNSESTVKDEQLQCAECDVQFKCLKEQKEHVQNQHSSHQNIQVCDMCDKVFNCVQSLQEHCRQDHGGAGCFMCGTCNKRFMTKLSFNRHQDTHNGKKEAICDLCGKAFSRADYLQTHYSIHLGKRNYSCSQCPRKFVRSIHLRAHEKIHSGIKDHVCKVCNKGFIRRDKLKEHMLRHLNIKRFQCPICRRDYAEKRDLKVHLKSHSK